MQKKYLLEQHHLQVVENERAVHREQAVQAAKEARAQAAQAARAATFEQFLPSSRDPRLNRQAPIIIQAREPIRREEVAQDAQEIEMTVQQTSSKENQETDILSTSFQVAQDAQEIEMTVQQTSSQENQETDILQTSFQADQVSTTHTSDLYLNMIYMSCGPCKELLFAGKRVPDNCNDNCTRVCICLKKANFKNWICKKCNWKFHITCIRDDSCSICTRKCNVIFCLSFGLITATTLRQLDNLIASKQKKMCADCQF
jgi:hypothetical protein